jgi:hypothetical protein
MFMEVLDLTVINVLTFTSPIMFFVAKLLMERLLVIMVNPLQKVLVLRVVYS